MPFVDVDDDVLEKQWGCSVAEKLRKLGDTRFLEEEDRALGRLKLARPSVVALTGSNPLATEGFAKASRGADVVFLDVERKEIEDRAARMKVDRIVGMGKKTTLSQVLEWRNGVYEKRYTLRVTVAPQESVENIASKVERVLQERGTQFVSTRSSVTEKSFAQVLVRGLAPDGGLYLPNSNITFLPGELDRMRNLPYAQVCKRVLEKFNLEMSPADLEECIQDAYWPFSHPDVLPLRSYGDGLHVLETWHGPTASFKDLSLQLLPRLLAKKLDEGGQRMRKLVDGCIVATSGDTGSAALDGFARAGSVPVVVLFPENGVSPVQKLQMIAERDNAHVIGVQGADFDFCQTLVKKVLNDKELTDGCKWTSANSINLGRLLPQIVFSVSAYCQLLRRNPKTTEFDMAIPTGNFGNILAAILAKRMGLPLRRVILASNENNVLADFVHTGIYDLRQRKFLNTISPSIDILLSSNLERWLYLLLGGDSSAVLALMTSLKEKGFFQVSPSVLAEIQTVCKAGWCSQSDCVETIKETHKRHGLVLDPHTAVAAKVAGQFTEAGVPMVVVSTAHWGKFPATVGRAIFGSGFDGAAPLDVQWGKIEDTSNRLPPSLRCLLEVSEQKKRNAVQADEKLILDSIKSFIAQRH